MDGANITFPGKEKEIPDPTATFPEDINDFIESSYREKNMGSLVSLRVAYRGFDKDRILKLMYSKTNTPKTMGFLSSVHCRITGDLEFMKQFEYGGLAACIFDTPLGLEFDRRQLHFATILGTALKESKNSGKALWFAYTGDSALKDSNNSGFALFGSNNRGYSLKNSKNTTNALRCSTNYRYALMNSENRGNALGQSKNSENSFSRSKNDHNTFMESINSGDSFCKSINYRAFHDSINSEDAFHLSENNTGTFEGSHNSGKSFYKSKNLDNLNNSLMEEESFQESSFGSGLQNTIIKGNSLIYSEIYNAGAHTIKNIPEHIKDLCKFT